MSKVLLASALAFAGICASYAQEAATDTIAAQHLQEVVVKASKVVRKAGMDIYYPSQSAVGYSKDGIQLISNLQIPTLMVNDVMETLTVGGSEIQVRINGRTASVQELKQTLPSTIKKIEWTDTPGVRYAGQTAVLNVVTANPEAGGSLMTNASQAFAKPWGKYNTSLKLNHGYSQYAIDANYFLSNHIGIFRDYSEKFTHPDGKTLTRTETPLDGGYSTNNTGGIAVSWSYIKPEKTTIYIGLSSFLGVGNNTAFRGQMSLSDGSEDINLLDKSTQHGSSPRLNAYIEHRLPHGQTIAANVAGSYWCGKTGHIYREDLVRSATTLSDINTAIRDRNFALGAEVNYIKEWKTSLLTAGTSYTGKRNRSEYANLAGRYYHQRQDKLYFFAEYTRRINNLTLKAGLGGEYSDFRLRESGRGNSNWHLRPQATIAYRPGKVSQWILDFTSWQESPSLAQTNLVPQQIDGFQWQVGDPSLEAYSNYMLSFKYNFTLPRLMGQAGVMAYTQPDVIVANSYWEADRLVSSYENSRVAKGLVVWLAPQVEVIPRWLTVSGTLKYRLEQAKAPDFNHTNRSLAGNLTATATHWGCTMSVVYERAARNLFGEKIRWGEDLTYINFGYNWRGWQVGAGILCPFIKYDQGSKNLNRWNTNEQHLRISMKSMPYLRIAKNLQWGRQKRSAQRLINVDASTQQSKAAGR